MDTNGRRTIWLRPAIFALAMIAVSPVALGREIVVRGGSIQDAVDRAEPGDTIIVKPGIYTGSPGDDAVVTITKDDITIKGSRAAVIDARGFEYGIMVGEDASIGPAGCPAPTVEDFRIKGLTIMNAADTGLRLVGVEGYSISHGVYLDNEEYGPFPLCSTDGVIAHNFASGHKDAAIYVGDDDGVVVAHNTVTRSTIGIEVENSANAVLRHNQLIGNTTGILVVVLPGLPMAFTENIRIEHNAILRNNFPNPVPRGGDVVGLLPTGTGILNLGGDNVSIAHNLIVGNDSLGLAIIANFFAAADARIEPFVDDNEVRQNTILGNGSRPDPERAITPGADIVFIPDLLDPATGGIVALDPDPRDNCFADNVFESDFPVGIVGLFPCSDR